MKINIDREMLLKAVITADSIVSSKNVNTILSNCLFNVSKDQIEIISTDNEIAIRTKIDAVSDGSISFTANGKKFSSFLKELPNDEIVLDINDSLIIELRTKSKEVKGHYTLIGTSTEEYPAIPSFDEKDAIELDQPVLREMIKKVVYAASHDTIKPVFNGIFLVSEKNREMTVVSTDSRRLSMITRIMESNDIKMENGFIIPLKTVNEIFRLLESAGRCRFSYNRNQCFFRIGNTEIISRVVDGQFPNYKHVIPSDHIMDVVIETQKLLKLVKRVIIFTREPANKIICHFKKDTLVIEASTPELGEAREEIDIENSSSESITIGINAQFFIDCLKEIDSYSIRCGITGQMSPVTITPEDDSNYVSVIMPIQIKSGGAD
jgi:DNA polymerase-3 subunit beta